MVTDTSEPNLIIRADATIEIGSGHVTRSMALAQSWLAITSGTVTFVTNCRSEALLDTLKNEGFKVIVTENSYPHAADGKMTQMVLGEFPTAWCVVDGYHFDTGFQSEIRKVGNRLLAIDDTAHLEFYAVDAILNQNINADELRYNCSENAVLLLGTSFSLLRREFLCWRNWRRETAAVARKILVTMGGTDLHNLTLKVIRAIELLKIENLEVKAVIGSSNPHLAELRKFNESSRVHTELVNYAENMPQLMAWADICVSAAGSTSWELAFMQLPSVLIVAAENQVGLAQGLSTTGFAENVGWFEGVSDIALTSSVGEVLLDEKRRRGMSEIGRDIVDGRGASRVAEFLAN